MPELDGKVAVVTGAGSGLGKAAAQVLAGYGAKILAADISGAEKDTAASIGRAAISFRCDVTEEPQVEAMLRAAVYRFGRVDAVLNSSPILTWRSMTAYSTSTCAVSSTEPSMQCAS
jgi:NAD(P)-dependent dehydrogenase (short-subunit alcohol dehydrogenase family)